MSVRFPKREKAGGVRPLFTAFDPLLIAAAFLIMLVGFARRWSSWRMGREESRSGELAGLMGYLLGHKRILRNRYTGTAHLMLFWGLAIPVLIVVLAQFRFAMPDTLAGILSLFLDILGSAILVGTLLFFVRRIKSGDPETPKRTVFPLVVLLIILLTGFFASGARLSIIDLGFSWSSPVAWLLSHVLPKSPLFMQFMIRIHFFLVLFFIAILPFTFMRHVAAAPLKIGRAHV